MAAMKEKMKVDERVARMVELLDEKMVERMVA